jgi:hypothetical protein
MCSKDIWRFMKALYERQNNNQVVVVNMKAIIDEIRKSYPHETSKSMAATIGVTTGAIKRWLCTDRARKIKADALISAYPVPPPEKNGIDIGKEISQRMPLSELFDSVFQGLSEIRSRLGA